jgi:hypothetical protein
MVLTEELVERARPHAVGKGRVFRKQVVAAFLKHIHGFRSLPLSYLRETRPAPQKTYSRENTLGNFRSVLPQKYFGAVVTEITPCLFVKPLFCIFVMSRSFAVREERNSPTMTAHSDRNCKIRNDILKLLYATMLVELPAQQVKQFWGDHPLKQEGAVLADADLLRYIWDETKHASLAYTMSVLGSVEPFLVSRGVDTLDFVDKLIVGLNKGAMVGVGPILGAMAPFLRLLFSSKDVLHFATANVLPFILRMVVPSISCQIVKHEARAGRATSVLLLNFDASFKKDLPPYDPYLFFARPLQLGPTRIGMAPLEEVQLLSDVRRVDVIVGKDLVSFDKDEVRIAGGPVGHYVGFHEYCNRNGISLDGLGVPDRRVVELSEAYVCPRRRREVMSKGCVFGAPVSLVKLAYRIKPQPQDQFLAPMIYDGIARNGEGWKKAAEMHSQMLGDLDRKLVFVFDNVHEVMWINGRRLAKSAPALILRDIVRSYVENGKTEFSNRDFTGDRADSKAVADNFSLKLQRLCAMLSEKCPEVAIARTGRGQFRFQVPCRVDLIEE